MELFKNKRGKIAVKLDTTEDRIAAFMMQKIDEDQLQATDQEIMNRWRQILSLLLNHHTPTQAVNAHVKLCKRQGKEISMRTAYYDLRHATKLWGNISEVSYQATLHLLYEYAMRVLKMALKDRDLREMNKAISEMREITKELHNLNAFEDDETREPSKFILQINLGEDKQMTFDLDDYTIMPDDISKQVLEAVNESEISTDSFMQIVDKAGNVDD